jgi:hypothetical protein
VQIPGKTGEATISSDISVAIRCQEKYLPPFQKLHCGVNPARKKTAPSHNTYPFLIRHVP